MIQDFAARSIKLSMREQQLIQTDVFTIPGKEFVEKFLKFLGNVFCHIYLSDHCVKYTQTFQTIPDLTDRLEYFVTIN